MSELHNLLENVDEQRTILNQQSERLDQLSADQKAISSAFNIEIASVRRESMEFRATVRQAFQNLGYDFDRVISDMSCRTTGSDAEILRDLVEDTPAVQRQSTSAEVSINRIKIPIPASFLKP